MFIIGEDRRLIVPRTELTYPGHNERMHENAATAPVDHVMADLEDACPYEFKGEKSRNTIIDAFNQLDYGDKVVTFRPNNIHSTFFLGDVESLMRSAVDKFHGIILPKVTGPEDIIYVSRLLDSLELEAGWNHRVQIEALIETPEAMVRVHEIATASPRMAGLIFGIADFAAVMGIVEVIDNQNINFHAAKQTMAVAAKAAGLHAIDNVFFNLVRRDTSAEDKEVIEESLYKKNVGAANLGMDGTWVIHPQQAEMANKAYTPSDELTEYSKGLIEYYHKQGGGAFVYPETGEFVDEATAKGYLVLLAKAGQAGKLDTEWLVNQAKRHAEVTGYDVLHQAGRSLGA